VRWSAASGESPPSEPRRQRTKGRLSGGRGGWGVARGDNRSIMACTPPPVKYDDARDLSLSILSNRPGRHCAHRSAPPIVCLCAVVAWKRTRSRPPPCVSSCASRFHVKSWNAIEAFVVATASSSVRDRCAWHAVGTRACTHAPPGYLSR
jgi:hypothetical protein